MRPTILFPLFADVTTLKGVGAKIAPHYARLCGTKIVDLLWHLPVGLIDRTYSPKLRYADKGKVATLHLTILEHIPNERVGRPYRIIATDGSGEITLTYFTAKGDYLSKIYPLNKSVVVSGNLERFGRGWTMSHPDYALPPERAKEIPSFEPVYPLTEGLSRKMVHKTAQLALAHAPDLAEWNDPHLMKREGWTGWRESLLAAHNPTVESRHREALNGRGDPSPHPQAQARNDGVYVDPSRQRLAYDELLADQLALGVIRRHHRQTGGRALKASGTLQQKLLSALPFTLTKGQQQAAQEIINDMVKPKKMLRLLQGDVGSGKTIVALMAMLHAVEAGVQTAMMVPTEILARQHYERLKLLVEPLGLTIGLLVGKSRAKDRQAVLQSLEEGSLNIVIGTHALFQADVTFANLGLAVMDEQHRFGVHQRLQLSEKGRGVDILVMTATPIPRTLTLTAFGDMDVSRLMEKPAGRQPIDTRLIDMGRLEDVIEGVGRQIAKGAQVYWVCPLVEESEKSDLAAATERANLLAEHLGANTIGLVHGRLSSEAKNKVMEAFAANEIKVLIATTVIEVGVDVPNASLMIIEHSERFGLAQLHQLRGRIGRGATKSTCLLMYQSPLGEIAKSRLTTMRESEDGFLIAEEDLRLRGSGELLGTRQSGMPSFRIADLARDHNLLAIAHADAETILAADPELATERGKALRTLLYLFEKDAAVRLFRSG
ncbi:MAG: ATP-dependent DNA helicase RecG [Alphaproteobacteria bacterium]|nr:ATP-dependent DNA helicase RecG [Alphaproteobacteria bacterium]